MLSALDRTELLRMARTSLETVVRNGDVPDFQPRSPALQEAGAVFVTLRKRDRELRGCIGHVDRAHPLWKQVRDSAAAAATKDPRFPSVMPEEIPALIIEISVLSPFQQIRGSHEIVVGRDGLYIKKGSTSGILLPQVACEWKWDAVEFLRQTCLKARLAPDAWRGEAEVHTFTAEVFSEDDPA